MTRAEHSSSGDVLKFWREAGQSAWFKRNENFDAEFRKRFLEEHHAAARREHDDWARHAAGALALVILLDQFPRNAFRGSAHAFATDALALHFAESALEAGHDRNVDEALRIFFYMPFEHSERMEDQERALALIDPLGDEYLRYAEIHRDVIARFGRFPHRNRALGRVSTPDEQAFLDSGGFSG